MLSVPKGTIAMGLVTILIGLGCLAMPVLGWKQTLELTDSGFTWTRVTGVLQVRRDEVKKVTLIRHHSRMGFYEELKVELNDGRELAIEGVERAEEAANLIHAMTSREVPSVASTGWKAAGAKA
ncbi:MAG: hypothetical protein DI536_35465 [Archangium gephyra]|uniref:DUF304 domain-containing protein n=1 Tax=Archangium gephyra TaxID=48 RepID=A0A2W5SKS2_9BACT|nr:MAG: hypothetical protein DI536_35465 [Archangium gephyra]